MVRYGDITTQECVSWTLLPLIVLEGVLFVVTLWRLGHQVWWKSHPRRVFFHLALLLSCVLRCLFWFGLCHPALFASGLAFLWWSNSLILLCTASIILQWSSAVAAGRVTAQEMQRTKKFGLHHPLVFLHSIHLLSSLGGGIDAMLEQPDSTPAIEQYASHAEVFLVIYRVVNVVTVAVDAVVACIVACQLRQRLLSAAMTDEMKRKSVTQMTLLILCMMASLLLQSIMDVPTLAAGFTDVYNALTLTSYCVLKFFVPGVLLSACFLYIMRRVEQREPARLVIAPTQSLVEFEECAAPCVWCSHHRRFQAASAGRSGPTMGPSAGPGARHAGSSLGTTTVAGSHHVAHHHPHHHSGAKGKWDPMFLSPLTTDSSVRSAQSSTHRDSHHEPWAGAAAPRPPFPIAQPESSHAIRFNVVDDRFPAVRFSLDAERQYPQHRHEHYYSDGLSNHMRGPGAPYS